MKILEMKIEEDQLESGISAISIVEQPAIESNFIALSKEPIKLAQVSAERRILMGAALIPDKPIVRKDDEGEPYYIYFSKSTVNKASELFLKRGYQRESTLEHSFKIDGVSVVESWIVEDTEKDKSALYGLSVPKGTWMVSMKVYDENLWEEYVKTGKVKGFSIEGMFGNFAEQKQDLVKPKAGESKAAYLSRCVPVLKAEGKELNQAIAICIKTYENEL